jgi:hypothetical protein
MLPLFVPMLLIVAALCGCGRKASQNVFLDPALATLVPPDAIFLAGIRVQQLEPTPVYQRYVKTGKIPLVEQFARETGVDVHKDLWEVVIAHDGQTRWVMLRGKFTEMGMEPRVKKEGAARIGYKGYTMLGDESMAVVFLNPTTAIAASAAALKKIIDNRDRTTGVPGWLDRKVKTISSENQVWFAGDIGGLGDAVGSLDFRAGVHGHVSVAAKSPEEARRLRDGLNRRVVDGVNVRGDGSSVEVTVGAGVDRLDELAGWAGPLISERKP